jgi:DNA polymerase-3 subunit delta'
MKIIGHQKIRNFLVDCFKKNSLGQAYIFNGPESVGKFLIAVDFAEKINGKDGAKDGNIICLAPETEEIKGVVKKKDIKIENIRELIRKLNITASGGKRMIAIINDAEHLTVAAQNSLLKTLEEPPQNSIIILIVKEIEKILPTIISRCQNIRFGILSDEEIEELVPLEKTNRAEIIFWSFGRPGIARELVEDESELGRKKEILNQFKKLIAADAGEKLTFAEKAVKNLPELIEMLNFWNMFSRSSLLGKNDFIEMSGEKALRLIGEIEKSERVLLETNSNPKLVLENLLLSF